MGDGGDTRPSPVSFASLLRHPSPPVAAPHFAAGRRPQSTAAPHFAAGPPLPVAPVLHCWSPPVAAPNLRRRSPLRRQSPPVATPAFAAGRRRRSTAASGPVLRRWSPPVAAPRPSARVPLLPSSGSQTAPALLRLQEVAAVESRPARNPLHPISRSRSKPPYLFQPEPRPTLLPSQALLTIPLLVRPTTRSLLLACSLE